MLARRLASKRKRGGQRRWGCMFGLWRCCLGWLVEGNGHVHVHVHGHVHVYDYVHGYDWSTRY
jgi:hypothetical protein